MILEDTWVNDQYSMEFSADGTGVLTYNKTRHEGTWEYVEAKEMLYFRYQQYGDMTIKLTMGKYEGEYRLYCNYFTLQKKSVKERLDKEAKETAEKKLYSLKWNEEITLDFMSFSLADAKVYRSLYQMIDDYPWTYSTVKGKKYLVIFGTVKNLGSEDRWIGSIRAEVTLDEKNYPMDVYAINKGDTYYNSSLAEKGSAKLCFAAQLPESVADSFKTAKLRFSFYNYLSGTSQKDYEGDFFFQLSFGETKANAARKPAARAKTYFVYGKNKSIPKPSSYDDVREETGYTDQKMHPTTGKMTNVMAFYFQSKFEDGNIADVLNNYVKGLKKDGFTVTKVDGKKSKYQNENYTIYTISKGKTALGWIEQWSSSTPMVNVIKR